ncbi:MAG: hypothetical protein VKK99_06325 [Cyanobacteriota bacterium]|nr:hypothetical protein [Cyanobacteriota bacterium]
MRQLVPLLVLALALPPAHAGGLMPLSAPEAGDTPATPLLLARGRGGGGGGHHRGGGGGSRARTGLGSRQGNFDRGNRRPTGGWSNRLGDGDRGRRDFDRARSQLNNRMGNVDRARDQWREGVGRIDRDRVQRSFDRVDKNWGDNWRDNVRTVERGVDRLRRWDNDWPGWARPGWQLARPWSYGWYGNWNNPPWGWWSARSVAWGLGSLATAAVITNAVDQAIAASQPTIVVQDAGYSLYYNSVEPTGAQSISFTAATGNTPFEATGNCEQGELNGREPASAAQAQLLNAACQVAFGS